MRKNKLNHNREFMLGIMAMALVVLAVVVLYVGQGGPEFRDLRASVF